MNFEFSDELLLLRDQAERLLSDRNARGGARRVLDGLQPYDITLWQEIAGLGWIGANIPERYGGAALGTDALCILAEQLGRSLAAVPFWSSACIAAEAISMFASPEQKASLLPGLASGSVIGSFIDATHPHEGKPPAAVRGDRISAQGLLVPDGAVADIVVIAGLDEDDDIALCVVELGQESVSRHVPKSIDPTRGHGRLTLARAWGARLQLGCDRKTLDRLLARALIPVAFEQVGGATACLELARDYALERHAFGRPIGSFQAIKHKLARMFIQVELARSSALYGALALSADAPDLEEAAAVAHLSATQAYHLAARETIEVFGGIGFTWEADCHLYLRRAKLLSAMFGSDMIWNERVLTHIEPRYR